MATPYELYKEFLGHYGLENGYYYHSVELPDHAFQKVERVRAIRIGDTLVPLSPAVANSAKFKVQLHLAPIQAEKEIKKYIGSYKGLILDEDDVNLFCFTAEEAVLRNLLWPFHLLTEEAALTERHFFPLANMMEGVVCDTQEAIFGFLQAVLGSTDQIDAERKNRIERENRRTDEWAANAPVEVSGTIRRQGKYLEVSATARSTVTSGMVNAEYQVHALLANQNANREKSTAQRALMNELEQKLLAIIASYKKRWYDCLRTLDPVIGKNVLRDAIISAKAVHRPDQRENMIEIINEETGEILYSNLAHLLRDYGYDFDDLFGKLVSVRILNSYNRDRKVDVDDFYYDFYGYFYDVEHPLQHGPLFERFRESVQISFRKMFENVKGENPEFFCLKNQSRLLSPLQDMLPHLSGLTKKQENRLEDDVCSVFYDVLGDAEQSDFYRKGAPRFEF